MIRCALAEIRSPLTSTRRARSASSSSISTFGSITTPFPITQRLPGYRMPEGIRCSFHSSSPLTIVCPALLPPWKRTTASPFSASRSVIFPFPSSPHWAPPTTIPGIASSVYAGVGRSGGVRAHVVSVSFGPEHAPLVLSEQTEWLAADRQQPRKCPLAELLS